MNKLYDNPQRIADDILRLIGSGKTEDALDAYPDFRSFLEENEYAGQALENLSDPESYRAPDCNKAKDVERLMATLRHRKRSRKARIMAVSCAACVMIAAAIVIPISRQTNIEIPSTLPQPHPVFISGSGEQIELNAHDGCADLQLLASNFADDTRQTGIESFNQVIVPAQNMLSLVLPDGSEVVLNAESSIRYPSGFGNDCRELELKGEGYFKVRKSNLPLRIIMGESYVQVHGTEFNAEYRELVKAEVVLVNGCVSFGANNQEITLSPGQRCEYSITDENVTLSNVETADYLSWTRNEFKYESIAVADLLMKVSDWYGVRFDYRKEELSNTDIYISSNRDVALADLLSLLENSTNLNFRFDDKDKLLIHVKLK